jgi:hypothetical protein
MLSRREPLAHPRRRGGAAAAHRGGRWGDGRYFAAYRRLLDRHRRLIRRVGIGSGILASVLVLGCLALWWRLASGPIQLDIVTPWLASAIEENFGSSERVEVGGTQIERTANGGAAVRIRDIVVRDLDGTVVARAPKAEIHVSALSLFTGRMRAESLNLVGAELHVRIQRNGEVTVFAGAQKHPIATATVPVVGDATLPGRPGTVPLPRAARPALNAPPGTRAAAPGVVDSPRRTSEVLAAVLSWLDSIGKTGLDGHDLRELGLKEGTLTVDDERIGKQWGFSNITLSLDRPRGGGVAIKLGSQNAKQPWAIAAAIKPVSNGSREIQVEAHHILASDLIRALRLGDGGLQTNLPLSGTIRGVIGADGMPQALAGQVVAEAGFIGDANGEDGRIQLDRAEFKFNWDAADHTLTVPFQIVSGANRITLLGEIDAPDRPTGQWFFKIGGGTVVLATPGADNPLILNRIALNGSFDPVKQLFAVNMGDLGNTEVSLAMSGSAAYSKGDLQLNAGFAGKRMSVEQLKRLWPVFVAPKVRDWIFTHLDSGTVDHITIAVNAPLETLKASGPPIPGNGLMVDALAVGCVIQPVDGLPALHDADLNVRIVGRDAQISVGRATATLNSGRKLVLSSGLFEVPDTAPRTPPARVRFKLEGQAPAAAELLTLERLRDISGTPFDPATTHGSLVAQVALAMPLKPDLPPGSTNYSIVVDATNFSADHMIMGQRLEAPVLHVTANPKGFQFKGDVRIAGAPANLEYRMMRGEKDAEIKIQGSLDATARKNLGLDPLNTISGSIPIRVTGRVDAATQHDGRFNITADLTSAQIDGFLPGWVKPAGKPARATLSLINKPESTRIEELVIEGSGDGVKGTVDLDGSGGLQSANFQSYGFSDGDKVTLKAERTLDGALRVTMRGEVYDARGFIKTLSGGLPANHTDKHPPPDIDLDLRIGAVLAFNGEALSNVDLKMSRRAGVIRSLGLTAKIGRNGTLTGALQSRDGREVVDLRTNDAGALFRATDVYARMTSGQMEVVMGLPSPDSTTQQGTLDVRNFRIHDEAELQRAASGARNGVEPQHNDLQFSSMRVDFTRAPGRIALRNGVVRGPVLGGTIDGMIDYRRDGVDLRGTLVPLYGPNNLLGWIPLVGPIFGGQKEGVFGFTYQVVGQPGRPVLNVNILSLLAPGVLRKIFEYPAAATDAVTVEDQR